jgi:hypothetical protein
MDAPSHVASVAQVIQAAVAPVFLLAGVGTTLNVLATRIGRIIDGAGFWKRGSPRRALTTYGSCIATARALQARHAHQSCDRPVRAERPARVAGGRGAVRELFAAHRSRLADCSDVRDCAAEPGRGAAAFSARSVHRDTLAHFGGTRPAPPEK